MRPKLDNPTSSRSKAVLTGSVGLLLALALPGVASAYWACVSYGGNSGTCIEVCIEYNDCTHEATGRWKFTVSSDSC